MDASRDEEKRLNYSDHIHISLRLGLHIVVLASMSRCTCVQVSLQDMQCASKQKLSSQGVEFMKECVVFSTVHEPADASCFLSHHNITFTVFPI